VGPKLSEPESSSGLRFAAVAISNFFLTTESELYFARFLPSAKYLSLFTFHLSLLTMWLLWALLSALFAGLTAVFAKIGVVSINSNLATAIRTSIIVVITWGIALTTSRATDLLRLPMRSWLFLSLSAIATGLSWLCYFRALQIGEVAKVAPIDKLSVVVAIVISVLFLGERLSVRESLGVCLIVCGALCLAWK
jgi:transporter family protein